MRLMLTVILTVLEFQVALTIGGYGMYKFQSFRIEAN